MPVGYIYETLKWDLSKIVSPYVHKDFSHQFLRCWKNDISEKISICVAIAKYDFGTINYKMKFVLCVDHSILFSKKSA